MCGTSPNYSNIGGTGTSRNWNIRSWLELFWILVDQLVILETMFHCTGRVLRIRLLNCDSESCGCKIRKLFLTSADNVLSNQTDSSVAGAASNSSSAPVLRETAYATEDVNLSAAAEFELGLSQKFLRMPIAPCLRFFLVTSHYVVVQPFHVYSGTVAIETLLEGFDICSSPCFTDLFAGVT